MSDEQAVDTRSAIDEQTTTGEIADAELALGAFADAATPRRRRGDLERRRVRRGRRRSRASSRCSPPSATSTSRSRSAPRPTSRTTASASRAIAAAAEVRGVGRLARELLPALDNLDRALAAAGDDSDQLLLDGLRLAQRELRGRARTRRDRVVRGTWRAVRPGVPRGRRAAAARRRRDGRDHGGLPGRLPPRRHRDPASRTRDGRGLSMRSSTQKPRRKSSSDSRTPPSIVCDKWTASCRQWLRRFWPPRWTWHWGVPTKRYARPIAAIC